MKMKCCVAAFLMVFLCAVVQTYAKQASGGPESFVDIKAKAEKGEDIAQFELGYCYAGGIGVTQDYVEAVKWFRKAADKGNAMGQYYLGAAYEFGHGVEKNIVEAVKWYRKAAVQNITSAQVSLGSCYKYGEGVEKDVVEALKWYRKAAEQGDELGQDNLGVCYRDGLGVTQNYVEAVKWFRKAADQGFVGAQFNLGVCYRDGLGVAQDYAMAVELFRKAAEKGWADAQHGLAVCYYNGQGVTQDLKQAVKWLRLSANQGNAGAQFNLGLCNVKGEGVIRNDIEAYTWFILAASQGNKQAAQARDSVAKNLSREEMLEGQRRAAAFVPHNDMLGSSSDNSTSFESHTATGTGFFITDDGYLISNYHVVKDAAKVRLQTGAGLIDAAVVKVDVANDLALLKAVGRFAPLPIAASRTVKLGATVATVGFPSTGLQGYSPKLAKGEIASLAGASDDPRYFQISVPVQPGNSGGALVDARGNVVGIVSAKLSAKAALDATGSLPENVNYAVKSSLLLSFLESVPEVAAKLKDPNIKDEAFEEVVKSAQDAAVLVLVY